MFVNLSVDLKCIALSENEDTHRGKCIPFNVPLLRPEFLQPLQDVRLPTSRSVSGIERREDMQWHGG